MAISSLAGYTANCHDYSLKFTMEDDYSDTSDLSSPPASPRPPPGFVYPTPPPSQDAEESRDQCQDLAPARKKRRVEPKERQTQILDLSPTSVLSRSEQQPQIDLLTKTILRSRKIVVVAGAGISTSAGIPDFRSSDGLFKGLQKKHNLKASGKLLFDAAVYQDEALTATFHDMIRTLSQDAEAAKISPTPFHKLLARLGKENRLTRLYTQNIDCIETSLPPLESRVPLTSPWPLTVQLHGSIDQMVCQKCRSVNKLDRELFNSSEAPECSDCAENDGARVAAGHRSHGIGKLRPRIALYNEHNPDEEAITSVMNADVRTRPDALIVVGTSMKIPGVRHFVKNLCNVVRGRKNGVTMWINNEPPPGREFGESWDLVVKGNCDKVVELSDLKRLVDDSTPELPDFHDCNAAEVEDAKRKQRLSIPVPALLQKEPTGLCTPSTSNDEGPSGLPHRPAAGRPNPASKGPRLVDVLGKKPASKPASKAPRKPARKKSVPKRQGKKEPVKTSKITNFSTVTKSTSAATGKDEDKGLENATTKQMFPNLGKNATPCVEIHGRET